MARLRTRTAAAPSASASWPWCWARRRCMWASTFLRRRPTTRKSAGPSASSPAISGRRQELSRPADAKGAGQRFFQTSCVMNAARGAGSYKEASRAFSILSGGIRWGTHFNMQATLRVQGLGLAPAAASPAWSGARPSYATTGFKAGIAEEEEASLAGWQAIPAGGQLSCQRHGAEHVAISRSHPPTSRAAVGEHSGSHGCEFVGARLTK